MTMVVFAGQRVTATRLNRLANTLAKTKRTANVAGITTVETVVDTVTVNVTANVEYKIVWSGAVYSSAAGDVTRTRIRENNLAGTVIQLRQKEITIGGSQAIDHYVETFWTAPTTGSKTFVHTVVRHAGTGNMGSQAGADSPTFFYVEPA